MKDYDAIAREIYRDEAISRMLYYDQQEDQCVELIAAILRKHDEAAPTDEKALREALVVMREALGMAIHTAVNFGKTHPALDDMLSGPSKIYHDSEAILARGTPKDDSCEHSYSPVYRCVHCGKIGDSIA